MWYASVRTVQCSTIVRPEGSQKKSFPLCAFFYFCSSDPQKKRYFVFISSLMLNVVCTAEVSAAVWGTPSNFLCHNYWKMML